MADFSRRHFLFGTLLAGVIPRSGFGSVPSLKFLGYQSPNRYWEAPDGRRYWLTFYMINRCWPDSVEPLRRVA